MPFLRKKNKKRFFRNRGLDTIREMEIMNILYVLGLTKKPLRRRSRRVGKVC